MARMIIDNIPAGSALAGSILNDIWQDHAHAYLEKLREASHSIKELKPGEKKELVVPAITITLEG